MQVPDLMVRPDVGSIGCGMILEKIIDIARYDSLKAVVSYL